MAKANKIQRKQRHGGKKTQFLAVLLLIVLTPFLRYAMLVLILGLLPAFVASYVDNTRDRNLSRVVFSCNFAGVLPVIMKLFKRGITSDNTWATMMDPYSWLVMYGAAAFGWLLMWFFPQAVHFTLQLIQSNTIANLKNRQQIIVDEWGMQVESASKRALRNASFSDSQRKKRKSSH